MNLWTCSVTASTTLGALLPTFVTEIPDPKSIIRLPSTSSTIPADADDMNTGSVTPTPLGSAFVRRAASSMDRGPGISVTRCGALFSGVMNPIMPLGRRTGFWDRRRSSANLWTRESVLSRVIEQWQDLGTEEPQLLLYPVDQRHDHDPVSAGIRSGPYRPGAVLGCPYDRQLVDPLGLKPRCKSRLVGRAVYESENIFGEREGFQVRADTRLGETSRDAREARSYALSGDLRIVVDRQPSVAGELVAPTCSRGIEPFAHRADVRRRRRLGEDDPVCDHGGDIDRPWAAHAGEHGRGNLGSVLEMRVLHAHVPAAKRDVLTDEQLPDDPQMLF